MLGGYFILPHPVYINKLFYDYDCSCRCVSLNLTNPNPIPNPNPNPKPYTVITTKFSVVFPADFDVHRRRCAIVFNIDRVFPAFSAYATLKFLLTPKIIIIQKYKFCWCLVSGVG